MLAPVFCNGCGQRLEVPAGHVKSKLRCPECGVFSELPAEVRDAAKAAADSPPAQPPKRKAPKPTPRPAPPPVETPELLDAEGYTFQEPLKTEKPPSPTPPTAKDEPPDNEVLIEGTHDDDLNPYTVTGDKPTKRCPECDKKSGVRDKVCVHCGFNFESGEKGKRTFQPVNREWEAGWPLKQRTMAFVILQVVNFVTLVISVCGGNFGFGLSFTLILFSVGLQAFLIGTFDKLTLNRTQKGRVTLERTWRYAFIPRPPEAVKWKEHDSVIIVQSNEFDPIDWAMGFILLGYGVIPGMVFWWFVIRPDKFTVTLCKDHGYPETPIFRTINEDRAKEVMTTVCEVTTLPVQK